jgi:hypothetical protein
VSRLATRRLIDASETLDAADRALLNIWVNRGLDDAALARMTGVSEEAIADRRARIVERLSAELGLQPENIRSALTEIVASPEVRPAAAADSPAGRADAPVANGTAPASELADVGSGPNGGARPGLLTPIANEPAPPPTGDASDTGATAAAAVEPGTGPSSRRRRWLRSALGVFVIVAAVVVAVSLASSGSRNHRGLRPASSHTVPTTAPTSPSPPGAPLVALPFGPDHATGTVLITGSGPNLRLDLSVSNLPAASHGHYEVWLYDSIIYSVALGRLRTGARNVSFQLPGDAGRYHWIDVSFQPVGHVFHSGESVLRSANPLFARTTARRP